MGSKLLLLTFVVMTLKGMTESRPTDAVCTGGPADVVFVLDASYSIWLPDFQRQLTFVQEVIRSFDVGPGPDQTRVGVVTFGHGVWPQIYLDSHTDEGALLQAVQGIKHGRGKWTNTGDAISFMEQVMFSETTGSRKNVTHVGIVITDGRSQKTLVTQRRANNAQTQGIKVFAVSVGFRLDEKELKGIASDPDDEFFFSVDNYKALDSLHEAVALKECEVTTAQAFTGPETSVFQFSPDVIAGLDRCIEKKADVYFVLDSSSSIVQADFQRELEFVKNVIDFLDIGHDKTNVGVITFSNEVEFSIPLTDGKNKDDVKRQLDNVPYMGQGTDTAQALRRMREDGFSSARQDAAHIAVILTDGLSRRPDEVAKEAEIAQMMGIHIFSVGISSGIDKLELSNIASKPTEQFVFQVENFESLHRIKLELASRACVLEPVQPFMNPNDQSVCAPRGSTDLLFVYDAAELDGWKTQSISQFISKTMEAFDLRSGLLRVGREVQNCPDGDIAIGSAVSASDLSTVTFRTLTDMLNRIRRNSFSQENGGRPGDAKMMVLFIDKEQRLTTETLEQARRLKDIVDFFYIVAIGDSRPNDHFTALAGDGYHIKANTYQQLASLSSVMETDLCEFFSSNTST